MICPGADSGLLSANLSFLEGRSGAGTLSALKEAASIPSPLKVEACPGGGLAWRIGETLLHSARDPEGEAARLLQGWMSSESPDMKGCVVVMGFAGAYHLSALMDAAGEGALVFVADLSPESFLEALCHVDLRRLPRPGVELHFAVSRDSSEVHNQFRTCLRRRARVEFSVLRHPASARLNPSGYGRLLEGIKEQARIETMNRGTAIGYSKMWVRNAIKGLPHCLKAIPVDELKGVFEGAPAIIVGAGPSLSGALAAIKDVSDKAFIFAAGSALKPLLEAGVRPDFVVAVDNRPTTLKQIEGFDPAGIRLIAWDIMHPVWLETFAGRTFTFSCNASPELDRWLGNAGASPAKATVGGTVATTAMDLAVMSGCRKIILCGVDLSVAEDGTTHSAGSIHYGEKVNEGMRLAEGNYKREVRTNFQFSVFIRLIENLIYAERKAGSPVEFFNATDSGAKIHGAGLVLPAEIKRIVASCAGLKAGLESRIPASPPAPDWAKAVRTLSGSISELAELRSLSLRALEICGEAFAGGRALSGEAMEELSVIDAKLKSGEHGPLLLSADLSSLCAEMAQRQGEVSDPASLNVQFYSGVAASAGELLGVLSETAAIVKREGGGRNA